MTCTDRRQKFVALMLVSLLTVGLFSSTAEAEDFRSYDGSALGSVPAFRPELGLDWLEGYLGPDALPNSLALSPRPPEPGSAGFALDEQTARGTFALRETARFKLAESDYDLRFSSLLDDFSCAAGRKEKPIYHTSRPGEASSCRSLRVSCAKRNRQI